MTTTATILPMSNIPSTSAQPEGAGTIMKITGPGVSKAMNIPNIPYTIRIHHEATDEQDAHFEHQLPDIETDSRTNPLVMWVEPFFVQSALNRKGSWGNADNPVEQTPELQLQMFTLRPMEGRNPAAKQALKEVSTPISASVGIAEVTDLEEAIGDDVNGPELVELRLQFNRQVLAATLILDKIFITSTCPTPVRSDYDSLQCVLSSIS
jgi:hypothetical protein